MLQRVPICVLATILSAVDLGYRVVLVRMRRLEKVFKELDEAPRGKTCDAIIGIIARKARRS